MLASAMAVPLYATQETDPPTPRVYLINYGFSVARVK